MNPSIFREYDIRGIVGTELTTSTAFFLGRAYARLAKERLKQDSLTIAVGRDCRLTGEELSRAMIDGLNSSGAKVIYLNLVTTPMSYYSLHNLPVNGSIMVTGSHNPPEYNGFKICLGKGTLHGSDIQLLFQYTKEDHTAVPAKFQPVYEEKNIFPNYLAYLKKNISLSRNLKIVIDAGNGAAAPFAPSVFKELGCETTELFCEPDGRFPNHPADPTVPANLKDLINAVKETRADIGIAFDGDADRIGIVDEEGRVIYGDEIMVVFSRAILKKNPGATIISEVKSSHRLYNDIKKHGGNGIMWKTGHSLIKAKMKETGALLAGEMSGHIFFADRYFGYDDAIYAAARFLEILADSKGKTSSLLADLPKSVNTPEIRIDCDDSKKFQVVERIRSALHGKYTTNEIDGVRVEFGDGWGLVRASNTQPVIVMRFEAQTEMRLKEIQKIIDSEAVKAGLTMQQSSH